MNLKYKKDICLFNDLRPTLLTKISWENSGDILGVHMGLRNRIQDNGWNNYLYQTILFVSNPQIVILFIHSIQ